MTNQTEIEMNKSLQGHNNDVINRDDQREPDESYDDRDPQYAFEQFDELDPVALVRALDAWQQRKVALEDELKQVNKVFDFLRIVRIPAAFEEAGVELLKVDGVGRCSLTADMWVSITAGHKDEAYDWLRDTGRGSLITETVNSSTLKASIRKALLAAEPLPDGVFSVSPYTRASITHGK
jgi:hypothetical protein